MCLDITGIGSGEVGERLLSFVRGELGHAGIEASVEFLPPGPGELSPRGVAIVTDHPIDAWRVLSGQRETAARAWGPTLIHERLLGLDFVLGVVHTSRRVGAHALG